MLEYNVLITGFGYPLALEDTVRLQAQISAGHTRGCLEEALKVFEMLKDKM